ncbi:cysteine desulfurase NifS [[Eubacterium] cellulosolvens]
MANVYMDYAAGSPLDNRVLKEMMPYLAEQFGNPSSPHSFGQKAKNAIEVSRTRIVDSINAKESDDLVFTSGGTESNNLAIRGVATRHKDKGNHIITSAIEHMSVINTCKSLMRKGFEVTFLPVDNHGFINIEELENSITEKTILITIMHANGEVGTIQPIKDIGKVAQENGIHFHVDAVASAGKIPIDVKENYINLLSISSNDIYGPKGVGALYISKEARIQPIIYGGGQERGLRSGSENVPGIVGMGKAMEIAKAEIKEEGRRLTTLRDKLINGITSTIKKTYLNGHPKKRLPNNANIGFDYIEGESLILSLDAIGVQVSSGSACTSKTLEPSHVLRAIGLPHEKAHGSLLFTLGRFNKENDVEIVLSKLPNIVKRLRSMSPLTPKEILEGAK